MTESNHTHPNPPFPAGHPELREPSLLDALIPIIALVVMLSMSVFLYGSDTNGGGSQVALLMAAMIAALVAIKNGHRWPAIQEAIVQGISTAMGAILILLAVGALIGTWMLAGTVPTMIAYGVKLLNPSYFYLAACLICTVASVSIGSSWTVAGTLGVGLIGVSQALNLPLEITAGAVVSGAYFGDKMSPLSDTTNLAPAVAGSELFTHIQHMAWTTLPSYALALVLFLIIGLQSEISPDGAVSLGSLEHLEESFNLSFWTLLPLIAVFVLAVKKYPAFPTIVFGGLFGGLMAVILQPQQVLAFAAAPELPAPLAMLKGVWSAFGSGYVADTGNPAIDSLLSRGGMSSMLSTIWLILCALAFGAVMEHAGLLVRLIRSILKAAKSTGALMASVLVTCVGMNIVAADQYLSIVLPGRMYRAESRRRGLKARNLSRALEDAGTLTSPLVPWNTCGAFMASTLGVATLAYLPYALFNLINPVVSLIYGFTGFTILKIDDSDVLDHPGGSHAPLAPAAERANETV
jgi:NhaC family Na+:H+ antiporter